MNDFLLLSAAEEARSVLLLWSWLPWLTGLHWSDYGCMYVCLINGARAGGLIPGLCWCRGQICSIHNAITSCWCIALRSLKMSWVNFQSQARDGTLHHYLRKCWVRASAEQRLVLCWEDHGHCAVSEKEIPFVFSDPGQWELGRGWVSSCLIPFSSSLSSVIRK